MTRPILTRAGLSLCGLLALGCGGDPTTSGDGPATLGATLHEVTAGTRREFRLVEGARGVVLADVEEKGPAGRAGLHDGDLLEAFDGRPVAGVCELDQALAERRPGQEVKLAVLRGAERREATVRLADAAKLYTRSCEEEGRASACHHLALLQFLGKGMPADMERGVELLTRSCDGGYAQACADLALVLHQGTAGAPDPARELALAKRACDAGNPLGCTHLGFLYATGRGVARDAARSSSFYQRACEDGNAEACFNVGLSYEKGEGGVPPNHTLALFAYGRACDGGSTLACTNLGYMYEHGMGVAPDEVRAAGLYRRGCEGGPCREGDPTGCFNLGVFHREGRGGLPLDKTQAASLFERSCDRGSAVGCANLADLLAAGDGVPKDEKRAAELFRRACEGGHEVACHNAEALAGGGS